MTLRSTVVAVVAGVLATLAVPAVGSESVPAVYRPLMPALRKSAVPVLLPYPVPAELRASRIPEVVSAGSDGYYVGFGVVAGCNGALSCAHAHVSGYPSLSRAAKDAAKGELVRLADGSRAHYRPRDCRGAGCSEASLSFARGRATYELDADVARDDLPVLERMYAALKAF